MITMTLDEWKKNDALLKVAFEKMNLNFKRNQMTWEPIIYSKNRKVKYIDGFDVYDELVMEGPTDPISLGTIKYFRIACRNNAESFINNIFFGVESYEELKIQVDLLN